MKFSTKEDAEAPMDEVFAMMSQFDQFERWAIRRGAEVVRKDKLASPGVGMQWDVAFRMRGKRREVTVDLVLYEPPLRMSFATRSPGVSGLIQVDLVALSRHRTRMAVQAELKPQTLAARLFIQSLKLARTNLNRRFKIRVADFAKSIEDRHKRAT